MTDGASDRLAALAALRAQVLDSLLQSLSLSPRALSSRRRMARIPRRGASWAPVLFIRDCERKTVIVRAFSLRSQVRKVRAQSVGCARRDPEA